ncbi:MAG: tripartite tricarboxylate transporter substrate binding protein [Acetobacteraceae bacterium]|nr:tripartite tricarboxylate transporter substrate binding protein [Acetobacteraceae bacterium]
MLRRLLFAAVLVLAAGAAEAQNAAGAWPDRPIRLLVPFAPGGVTDTIGRMSADWLSRRLGQPVAVENRTGAAGAIAAEAVARARPDGYTLLTASASQMVMLPALTALSFDPAADLTGVSIVASNPMVLGVAARTGAATLSDFVALARREAGRLDFSSAGQGSSNHLAMELLLHRAGIRLQHVTYRGGAPAMQALLTGEVAAYFGNPIDLLPHMQNPAIRVLGVASARRLDAMPDVPTVMEAGFPDFVAENWNGIAAPAGTPAGITARIAQELALACQEAAFRQRLLGLGTTPLCSTPAAFQAAMRRDAPIWREAVRASGARQE